MNDDHLQGIGPGVIHGRDFFAPVRRGERGHESACLKLTRVSSRVVPGDAPTPAPPTLEVTTLWGTRPGALPGRLQRGLGLSTRTLRYIGITLVLALVLSILLVGPFGQGNAKPVTSSLFASVASPSGGGWSTNARGDVSAHGGAAFYGSLASQVVTSPIVGIASTGDGKGYWLVAADGQIHTFGDAVSFGPAKLLHLNAAIVGMAATPDGGGYWEVASDGGTFSFGDAGYFGSANGSPVQLAKPIVGIAPTVDGGGYWEVASDGEVFAFGDAQNFGSVATSGPALHKRIIGMAPTPDGAGYWEVASTGRVYPFGDARSFSSSSDIGNTLVGMAPAIRDRAPVVRVSGNRLVNESGKAIRLVGVDASGTEDACVENKGFSWGPLTLAEAVHITSWKTNVVRVPLNEDCWLGINGVPARYSGSAYQHMIKEWVEDLNAAGLEAIIDLHWSAPGGIKPVEQWPMADADHSLTFWKQVATAFRSMPSVIFDLFNEPFLGQYSPHTSDWSCLRNGCETSFRCSTCQSAVSYRTAGMQQMLDVVREAGATQPVLVAGTNFAGDPCGTKDFGGDGGICQWLKYRPSDPKHEVIADFHTYDWTACATVSCWNASVLPVAAEVPVISAEFGEKLCSTSFIDQWMGWADQHDLSYLAWSWEVPAAGTGCAAGNLQLLSNWQGAPSVTSVSGAAVHAHLAKLAASG
jgi:endoglucanase